MFDLSILVESYNMFNLVQPSNLSNPSTPSNRFNLVQCSNLSNPSNPSNLSNLFNSFQ